MKKREQRKNAVGRWLKAHGIRQADAAQKMGISSTSFTLKATGRSEFKESELRVLKGLGMTVEEIDELFL